MSRIYQRRFDHDEAARLRATGMTYKRIGELLGVTGVAVSIALNPDARAQALRANSAWQKAQAERGSICVSCGGKAGFRSRSGICKACADDRKTESVRETTLRCTACREWKPDEDFTPCSGKPRRRDRHGECKSCASARRRAARRTSGVRFASHDVDAASDTAEGTT